MNGHRNTQKSGGKSSKKSGSCYSCKRGTNSLLKYMYLNTMSYNVVVNQRQVAHPLIGGSYGLIPGPRSLLEVSLGKTLNHILFTGPLLCEWLKG